ncbi:paeninodin family lasso peptide [Paenibacillus sp. GP183]|jgi:hypothetical protein|nr:paeninodin family lasso peptide [Paenibacillus sp. GP183]SEC77892.1 hypothetical protein SAMN05443246_5342 [Paenibacillus sp. GP183]
MDNFEKVKDEQRKKVWVTPELEILEVKNTLYWSFDDSGEFPRNVWVDES